MKTLRILAIVISLVGIAACSPSYESNPYLAGNWVLKGSNCALSFTSIQLTKDGHYQTNNNQSGEWSDKDGVINFNGNMLLIGLGDYRNMVIRDSNNCDASFDKL